MGFSFLLREEAVGCAKRGHDLVRSMPDEWDVLYSHWEALSDIFEAKGSVLQECMLVELMEIACWPSGLRRDSEEIDLRPAGNGVESSLVQIESEKSGLGCCGVTFSMASRTARCCFGKFGFQFSSGPGTERRAEHCFKPAMVLVLSLPLGDGVCIRDR